MGVVGLRSMLAGSRDRERESDIASIQNYLEDIYPREIRNSSGVVLKPAGSYPPHFSGASGSISQGDFNEIFADLGDQAKSGPLENEQFVSAKNGSLGINPISSPSELLAKASDYNNNKLAGHPGGAYIYYANNGPGTSCSATGSSCRRYILLYHMETVDANKWKVTEGKRL